MLKVLSLGLMIYIGLVKPSPSEAAVEYIETIPQNSFADDDYEQKVPDMRSRKPTHPAKTRDEVYYLSIHRSMFDDLSKAEDMPSFFAILTQYADKGLPSAMILLSYSGAVQKEPINLSLAQIREASRLFDEELKQSRVNVFYYAFLLMKAYEERKAGIDNSESIAQAKGLEPHITVQDDDSFPNNQALYFRFLLGFKPDKNISDVD